MVISPCRDDCAAFPQPFVSDGGVEVDELLSIDDGSLGEMAHDLIQVAEYLIKGVLIIAAIVIQDLLQLFLASLGVSLPQQLLKLLLVHLGNVLHLVPIQTDAAQMLFCSLEISQQ